MTEPQKKVGKRQGNYKPGPGRPKGSRNKNTRDLQALAQEHGPYAIQGVYKLTKDRSAGVRLAAFRELLDRGYGKAPQSVDLKASGGININVVTYTGQYLQPVVAGPVVQTPVIGRPRTTTISPSRTTWGGNGHGSSNNGSDPAPE